MSNPLYSNLAQLRQFDITAIVNTEVTIAFVLSTQTLFIWVNNVAGTDDNLTIITPASNPPVGRWVSVKTSPVSHTHQWTDVSKAGSVLSDLSQRSATDLDRGTLEGDRLPLEAVALNGPSQPLTVLAIGLDGSIVQIKLDKNYVASDANIPWDAIDFTGIEPNYVGAENPITFDKTSFNRSADYVKLLPATATNVGGVKIAQGLNIDGVGRLSLDFGSGDNQVLEGTAPFGGDLDGEHGSAIVNGIQTIPVTIASNEVSDKNQYVLTLDSSNPEAPFFYLAPTSSSGGGSSPFSITSFAPNVLEVEVGQTISSPVFTATFNGIPLSLNLRDSINGTSSSGLISPNSFHLTAPGSVSFILQANFSQETTVEATVSIEWLSRIYYGISIQQNSSLSASFAGDYNIYAPTGSNIVFAIPSAMGTPKFSVGGIVGGFHLQQSSIPIVNQFGVTANYDIWQSDNSGLGQITIGLN